MIVNVSRMKAKKNGRVSICGEYLKIRRDIASSENEGRSNKVYITATGDNYTDSCDRVLASSSDTRYGIADLHPGSFSHLAKCIVGSW